MSKMPADPDDECPPRPPLDTRDLELPLGAPVRR